MLLMSHLCLIGRSGLQGATSLYSSSALSESAIGVWQVTVLADTQLAFTKALGEVLDAEAVLGSKRSKR